MSGIPRVWTGPMVLTDEDAVLAKQTFAGLDGGKDP